MKECSPVNHQSTAFAIPIIVSFMPIQTKDKFKDLYNAPAANAMSMKTAKKKTKE